MKNLVLTIGLLCISYCCTGLFRFFALKKGMIDLPNERSSHSTPTPRGGGLVFVMLAFFGWMGMLLWLKKNHLFINPGNTYFLLTSLLIAMLGFVDDKYQLSATFRLSLQFVFFSVFIYWLMGAPILENLSHNTLYENIGMVLSLGFSYLVLLWFTNLYNFMDGINGIATLEAIFFLVSITVFYHDLLFFPLSEITWILCPLLAGFLLWNFPNGKLFMGDIGSSFLGAFIALICVYLATTSWDRFLVCTVLLATFITDATLTVFLRFCKRENVLKAHSSHAYQHASRYFGSHSLVTCLVSLINIYWLFPWAVLMVSNKVHPLLATVLAYLPIVILAVYFNAGKKFTKREIMA